NALHEGRRTAEEEIEIVRWEYAFEQIYAHAFGMMVILAQFVVRCRTAVADVHVDVWMLAAQFFELFLLDVVTSIARPKEKPHFPFGSGFRDGVSHAEHRRDPHAARDQHDRPRLGHVQVEIAGWCFDVEDVAFANLVAEKARRDAGRSAGR